MNAQQTRAWMIALLVAAAVVSVIGKKADNPWIGWVSFVLFLGAVVLYVDWRRRRALERHAAKTDDEHRSG